MEGTPRVSVTGSSGHKRKAQASGSTTYFRWMGADSNALPCSWDLDQKASKMGFDTGKEVNQVCFMLIKETETQKTSLQVPLINPDKNIPDASPRPDIWSRKSCQQGAGHCA